MSEIKNKTGEPGCAAASLKKVAGNVNAKAILKDRESTLAAVTNAQTAYSDFSAVADKFKAQIAADAEKLIMTDELFNRWDSGTAAKLAERGKKDITGK